MVFIAKHFAKISNVVDKKSPQKPHLNKKHKKASWIVHSFLLLVVVVLLIIGCIQNNAGMQMSECPVIYSSWLVIISVATSIIVALVILFDVISWSVKHRLKQIGPVILTILTILITTIFLTILFYIILFYFSFCISF